MSTGKPQVAFYWCASCGGCEEAVVDLSERLLDVAAAVDIVFWPCALDFKRSDMEALDDGQLTAVFINGAIRTDEQEEMSRLLRRKARVVVAFGACAAQGGIPSLANLTNRRSILDICYHHSPTVVNEHDAEPSPSAAAQCAGLELPAFHETVKRLSDVVAVDYVLPGCAPSSDNLAEALQALLDGNLPPTGSVLTPDRALCVGCPRNDSKPESVAVEALKRIVDTRIDPQTCFLAQGILCMGPATRDGCGVPCIEGNMPCTGCYGPTGDTVDQGGKMLGVVGGLLSVRGESALGPALQAVRDPAGTLYRYATGASPLRQRPPSNGGAP